MKQFLVPQAFWLFALLLPLGVLVWRDWRFQARAHAAWADEWRPRWPWLLRAACLGLGLAAVVLALARPVGDRVPQEIQRYDSGVLFMVDTSRSMLATDLKPSRLERAKAMILDVLERLDGQEVGLIAYAGGAVVKCPLTGDYNFFRLVLAELDERSVGRGGTQVGEALRAVERSKAFAKRSLDLVVLTDGEDQDSLPAAAAAKLAAQNVHILFVGLGDDRQGHPIPSVDARGRSGFVEYQGKPVLTRQDSAALAALARATKGARYLNWGTGTGDLGEIFAAVSRAKPLGDTRTGQQVVYQEFRGLFLALACLFLFAQALLARWRQP